MDQQLLNRIHLLFEYRYGQNPQQEFLFTPTKTYTFEEINNLVNQIEIELKEHHINPGDRILIVAENCPEHIALLLAGSRVGAWSCGVNARMSKGEIGPAGEV